MTRQCPVPRYQRPLSEYNDLKNSFIFSWTKEELFSFGKTLILLLSSLIFFTSIIVTSSYGWEKNQVTSIVKILSSALGMFNLWILRLYLAWKYVYNRLMNATVSYEESGWYDGQIWIKTSEILLQDRLVGTYEVLPILSRLRAVTVLSTIFIIILLFVNIQH